MKCRHSGASGTCCHRETVPCSISPVVGNKLRDAVDHGLAPNNCSLEGRGLKVDGGSTATYAYNCRGQRVSRLGGESLFGLGGEIITQVTAGTTTVNFNRYTVGSRLLAANVQNTTRFYHQDWLG